MEEILKVTNVTKYYGNASVVTKALNAISFSMEKGEFLAVMGASGSGKSTLLNVVATIDRVSSGEIVIGGRSLTELDEETLAIFRRDQLGFVFQEYNLLDTLTIGENIMLPLHLRRENAKTAHNALMRVAQALGIASQLSKFPYMLSGGQRQLAACARALITTPALVLADEPTGALDSKNSLLLMRAFAAMNSNWAATILMVTHNPAIAAFASRILFLKDGAIWHEIYRGDRDRRDFQREILSITAALGGDIDVL